MRQATMVSPGQIEFGDVSEPQAGPGQVLLRVRRIGICGSDVHVYHGRQLFTTYPVVQGHEFSAVVEAVGEGVRGVQPGAKATARPQIVCGRCRPCLRGDYNICYELKVRGFQAPGCAQDLFVTEADKVVLLPDSFTHEQGAMVEPAAVGVHATARPGDVSGRNVAVLGAGTIGNFVAQMACCRGANVLISDVSDFRLDVAKQCGIERTFNARSESLAAAVRRVFGEDGYDLAFDCAGAEAAINSVIESINKGGTIVVVAAYAEKPALNFSFVGEWELQLIGSLMYRHPDYEEAAARMAAGEIVTAPLDSKHFPFEEYPAAYEFINREGLTCMKVFVDL